MDTGRGNFEQFNDPTEIEGLIKKYPNHGGVFSIGEKIEVKGSRFKVVKITPKKLTLRLLKRG